jgi:hypothetical protein
MYSIKIQSNEYMYTEINNDKCVIDDRYDDDKKIIHDKECEFETTLGITFV